MDQTTYNSSYMASLPPQLISLIALPNIEQRMNQAIELTNQGFLIDGSIMVYAQDPYLTMELRYNSGYTWTPSFMQPPLQTAPGIPPLAGMKPYDPDNPPPGSILVYWPNPPAPITPPTPPPTTTFTLGPSLAPNYPGYYEMIGDSPSVPVGTTTVIDGHTYTKQIIGHSPFAPNGNVTGWLQG